MKKLLYCVVLAAISVSLQAQQPCSDLFFSEYVEGSSNNKAIEIYNPTPNAISLSGYRLERYTNGSDTVSASLSLTDILAPGEVYIIANGQADSAILAASDTTASIINFNGDDALALMFDTTMVDLIGEIGVDPGASWTVGTGATAEYTLIRKPAVQEGSTNWTTGANEWNVLPRDTIRLGAHTITPCGVITVRFASVAASVDETAGTYQGNLVLTQSSPTDQTVDMALTSGDAADVGNFATTSVLIPADSTSAAFSITITNDTLPEATEQFVFLLTNPSSGVSVDADSVFTLTIVDDDSILPPPPFYPIGAITTNDADGLSDSTGVRCQVRGVVYGVNLRDSGLQFTIHDGTGGIGVFSPNDFGYTVQEGDSVVVSGTVDAFAGLTQMEQVDTVYEVGTESLRQPTVVTALNESTESELVRINDLTLVDANQWDNSNPLGFTVDATNGTQTFEIRIEEQVDLFNANAPTGLFDIIGLGSQFDNSAPHDEGYQLLPRSSADLILRVGIDEEQGNIFTVYPNPNQGTFALRIENQQHRQIAIKVADFTGRIVFVESKYISNSPVDLSVLPGGLYVIEVDDGASVQRQKVSIR